MITDLLPLAAEQVSSVNAYLQNYEDKKAAVVLASAAVDKAVLAKQTALDTKKVEKVQFANAAIDLANETLKLADEDVKKVEAGLLAEAKSAGQIVNTIISHVQQAIFARCARTLEAIFHPQAHSNISHVVRIASQMQVLTFNDSRPGDTINIARRLSRVLSQLQAQADEEGLTK